MAHAGTARVIDEERARRARPPVETAEQLRARLKAQNSRACKSAARPRPLQPSSPPPLFAHADLPDVEQAPPCERDRPQEAAALHVRKACQSAAAVPSRPACGSMPARWQPVSSSTTRARNELVDAMLRNAHTLPDDPGAVTEKARSEARGRRSRPIVPAPDGMTAIKSKTAVSDDRADVTFFITE